MLRGVGFSRVLLTNDFTAPAWAVDVLSDRDVRPIEPALKGLRGAPISILGAGTGFGVACPVRDEPEPAA